LFQNNARKCVFALQIDRMLLSMFCMWFVTLCKSSFSRNPPYYWEITALESPPPPRNFRGGGMDIFWNHTFTLKKHQPVVHVEGSFGVFSYSSICCQIWWKMPAHWKIEQAFSIQTYPCKQHLSRPQSNHKPTPNEEMNKIR